MNYIRIIEKKKKKKIFKNSALKRDEIMLFVCRRVVGIVGKSSL